MTYVLEDQKLIQHEINKEMKDSYIDYAMSVIVNVPFRRQRRTQACSQEILTGMSGLGVTPDKPYKSRPV
ncbi:MAG: hypothetical protein ACLVHQ_02255 [Oscillospiraceae bacterium]